MRLCAAIVLGVTLVTTARAHKAFMTLIPNGDRIPHPCDRGKVWKGSGHFVPGGGGPSTRFGRDFKKYSMKWCLELCNADSDGDGRTNGEELGDPGCRWAPGSTPERGTNLSHPGICEPLESPDCWERNLPFGDALDCARPAEKCPAKTEAGVLKMDIRFPPTPIPHAVTNYFCLDFDLPTDGDYHVVATDPIIANSDIVHHMILFGCDEPPFHGRAYDGILAERKEVPFRCGMVASPWCRQIIGTWTLGSHGDCFTRKAGFRIGRHGYKSAALQIHWNNPLQLAGQTDSSGMTVYYTANRRYHDAAFLMVGQEYLRIPAHAPSVSFDATCPSSCTKEMFKQTIYVTRAINHMHYLGTAQTISLYRDGHKVRDFTNDEHYHYDNPQFYTFDPPIEVEPGDEIRTRCTYRSDRNDTVYYGPGTDDEMCFGFLTYYPTHNLTVNLCSSWKTVQRCHRYIEKFHGIVDGCDYWKFINSSNTETFNMIVDVNKQCAKFDKESPESCSPECSQEVTKAVQNKCLQNDIGSFIIHKMSRGKFGLLDAGKSAGYNLMFYDKVCGTVTNSGLSYVGTFYVLYMTLVFSILLPFI